MKYIISLSFGVAVFLFVHFLIAPISVYENSYFLEMSIKVKNEDICQFFYQTDSIPFYNEENSLRYKLKGSASFKTVSFLLEEPNKITKFRIDPVATDKNKTIEIKWIRLRKGFFEKVWMPFPLDFEVANLEKIEGSATLQVLSPEGVVDPMLFSNENMSHYIHKLPTLSKDSNLLSFALSCLLAGLAFYRATKIDTTGWKKVESLFVGLFIASIMLPVAADYLNIQKLEGIIEKRILAPKPAPVLSSLFNGTFDTYFNDHFPLRTHFVKLDADIKNNLFSSLPDNNLVLRGKDNWMFLNDELAYSSYSHQNLFSPEELKGYMNTRKKLKDTIEAQGGLFVQGFWPSKPTIYPEKISWIMKAQIISEQSLADQIAQVMRDSQYLFVDVREELLSVKDEVKKNLYYKYDTHWNSLGAFFGYRSFFNQLYPILGIKPFELNQLKIDTLKGYGSDLINIAGLEVNNMVGEELFFLNLIDSTYYFTTTKVDPVGHHIIITECPNATDERVVLFFRDSFTNGLNQFFSAHFKKVIYIWESKVNIEMVKKYQPELVFHLLTERALPIN